jgi:hypothetical protein
MSKNELINGKSTNREAWPIEARVCEKLWALTKKLRDSNLMQDYLDGTFSESDIDFILQEHDNSNMIQDIIDLQQLCSNMSCVKQPEVIQYNDFKYVRHLSDLGTILAKSDWWDRYETITRTMGVECVLSIRTAESLFKRDPLAKEITGILNKLIEENV